MERSRGLVEYVLYTLSLVYMLPLGLVLVSEPASTESLPSWLLWVPSVTAFVYYYFVMPLRLRPLLFPKSIFRILLAMLVMLFGPAVVVVVAFFLYI